eukprot:evm.model.scf_722EXC.4 EVM.evm.TU.scf_722EXC.4   scf_722EXC:44423-49286(+)
MAAGSGAAAPAPQGMVGWRVKGEGGAHVVVTCVGDELQWRGKVLRLSKLGLDSESQTGRENDLEGAVWRGVQGMDVADQLERGVNFVRNVMVPEIGEDYVCAGDIVQVPVELLRHLHVEQCGVVLPDHTVFDENELEGWDCMGPAISFEIKPKMGYLPYSPAIHPANSVKTRLPRFFLHQLLKKEQGLVSDISAYCPLDLFAKDAMRMKKAVWAMCRTPQNNLRIFLNGRQVQHGPNGFCEIEENPTLVDGLQQAGFHTPRDGLTTLVDVVVAILLQEELLPRILKLQQRDVHDIEGVHLLYQKCLGMSKAAACGNDFLPRLPSCKSCGAPAGRDAVADAMTAAPVCAGAGGCGHCYLAGGNARCQRGGAGGLEDLVSPGSQISNEHDRNCQTKAVKCQIQVPSLSQSISCSQDGPHGNAVQEHQAYLEELQRLPHDAALEVIRNYLVAAAAKDCSVFVTLHRLASRKGSSNSSKGLRVQTKGAFLPKAFSCDRLDFDFVYKIAVVDLDLKRVAKIAIHLERDSRMVAAARGWRF